MSKPRPLIERFFQRYEESSNTFDPDLVTSLYAEESLGCGPSGVIAVRNDGVFREAIPKRHEFMLSIGFQKAEIISLDETILDDHYSMVDVGWRMTFQQAGDEPKVAEFSFLYFLFISNDQPKVVMYISHDDEEATMRQMGLL